MFSVPKHHAMKQSIVRKNGGKAPGILKFDIIWTLVVRSSFWSICCWENSIRCNSHERKAHGHFQWSMTSCYDPIDTDPELHLPIPPPKKDSAKHRTTLRHMYH
jgi:hypothetical protein